MEKGESKDPHRETKKNRGNGWCPFSDGGHEKDRRKNNLNLGRGEEERPKRRARGTMVRGMEKREGNRGEKRD